MSEDRRQRVVEYLLGEMNEEDARTFAADRRNDPELDRIVGEMEPVIGRLGEVPAEAWDAPEPPPLIMPGLPPDPRPVPAADRATAGRRFAWPRAIAVLASAVVILGVGVFIGSRLDSDDPATTGGQGRTLALETIGEAPPSAEGRVVLAGSGTDPVTLDVSGLRPTGKNEFYELWLLGEDSELVALGSFRVEPGGETKIEVPLPVDPDDYEYFDVSIQPENGSPDHSGRSVLRGLTRS